MELQAPKVCILHITSDARTSVSDKVIETVSAVLGSLNQLSEKTGCVFGYSTENAGSTKTKAFINITVTLVNENPSA
jgi:hypothetical protein